MVGFKKNGYVSCCGQSQLVFWGVREEGRERWLRAVEGTHAYGVISYLQVGILFLCFFFLYFFVAFMPSSILSRIIIFFSVIPDFQYKL